jgi:uncharacterized protein YqjF (DUF2071 family)
VTDFPYQILRATAHRPWPMPDAPWVMTQSWHDLLFAHWPVAPDALRAVVPAQLPLDLFDGRAWIGVVPFHMTHVAPRGVPWWPLTSAFPELNVRTYVTLDDKPGVYFFSLDAGSRIAVATARALFHLPYYNATMAVESQSDAVRYVSRRQSNGAPPATFEVRYQPTGPATPPERGSLEYFLTERYCLYTFDRSARVRRLEIHHPPWPLQPAEATIVSNTMASAAGLPVLPGRPLLHFSKRQDVVTWWMSR